MLFWTVKYGLCVQVALKTIAAIEKSIAKNGSAAGLRDKHRAYVASLLEDIHKNYMVRLWLCRIIYLLKYFNIILTPPHYEG